MRYEVVSLNSEPSDEGDDYVVSAAYTTGKYVYLGDRKPGSIVEALKEVGMLVGHTKADDIYIDCVDDLDSLSPISIREVDTNLWIYELRPVT